MNRKEIKELAKSKIQNNKWNIIWPMLVITFVLSALSQFFGGTVNFNFNDISSFAEFNLSSKTYGASAILSVLSGIVVAGYLKYVLNFVRTGKFDTNEIIETIKKKWVNILVAIILTYVIITLCCCLLVIPGIIMALAYTFVILLVVDTDVNGNDALKKSREMMNGYKWNYFVFQLSFLGWILLIPFTLGLILIWLYPYMTVANVIYYEKLKEIQKK